MSEPTRILPVVGLTFHSTYPDNLYRLRQAMDELEAYGQGDEKVTALLIPEPENPHDPNAVAVHVPSLGTQVGHLKREMAAAIQPLLLDPAWHVHAWVDRVRMNNEHPDRPGLDVAVTRTPATTDGLF